MLEQSTINVIRDLEIDSPKLAQRSRSRNMFEFVVLQYTQRHGRSILAASVWQREDKRDMQSSNLDRAADGWKKRC
jgi:hypothetical protein